jgi:hypothetical protein
VTGRNGGSQLKLAFVETAVFTRRIGSLGLEERLRELQLALLENPFAGRLDPGTGGLRKVRLSAPSRGKGKSGGARVHYLYLPHVGRIYLIFIYAKNEADKLTPDQKRQLSRIVTTIKTELRARGI